MPLSLIHLLAARACHGGTLKRALAGDDAACRLLARLGIGPTRLADMRRGSAERLAKAKGGAACKTMGRVMYPSVVASVQDGCVVAVLRGPNHRADGQAAVQAEHGDLRTQADFEHQLAEADEHVRVTEKRLLHAAEFENEVLTLLGAEYRNDALDAIRALQAQTAQTEPPAAHEQDGMKPEHRLARIRWLLCFSDETLESDLAQMCLNYGKLRARLASLEDARSALEDLLGESASLLGIDDEDREGVPDAIRALQGRLAATESDLVTARDRVRAAVQCNAHGTTLGEYETRHVLGLRSTADGDAVVAAIRALLNRAESADAAHTPDTIADLLALPDYVRVEVWPVGDSFNARAVRQANGAVSAMGNTPREALIALYNHITDHVQPKATKPTKPLEPIVLGPWRTLVQGGAMSFRSVVGGTTDGVRVSADGWAVYDRAGSCVCHGEETGQAGRDAADKWARENGYVLLDAEPGSLSGVLPTLHRQTLGCGIYWWRCAAQTDVEVTIYEMVHKGVPGWRILQWLDVGETRSVAHGPQVGEEGKRYALAAAHALGLTGGGE